MSTKELPKSYNSADNEDGIYRQWEESGYFNPDNSEGEPYSIMMPPPNVTGVLHLGHALENSLMDIMARYQRMKGKKTLLVPGTDHAAIATQAKVEKLLAAEGIKNPRQELGREKLLEKIREYAERSKATILSQVKKLGTSCDWSRLAYTFDERRSRAVNKVFVGMYNDGLIYRGYRVVNWSVKGRSTCSDDEVIHVERTARLWTFRYGKDFPIAIASTRPETKLGDTAVAVNPNDKRYKKYIGKTYTVDVGAAKPLPIKIISDDSVDLEYGTGAVGVTPAHSAVDFEMYEKQKAKAEPIGLIQVIGQDGRMTAEAGRAYAGLTAGEARIKFVGWLEENDLLIKEEEINQSVGTSDRFGDIVEALPMTQWFIDVNKKIPGKGGSLKELIKQAIVQGHHGEKKQKINITPERFEKICLNWLDNLRDWCISRQIWWGHRIPVWYKTRTSADKTQTDAAGRKVWDLKIYGKDIFEALRLGAKRIETRAGRPRGEGKYWGDIKPGDVIVFSRADEKTDSVIAAVKPLEKQVEQIIHFNTLSDLFEAYRPEDINPGKSSEEIEAWWKKSPEMKKRIEIYGIWAIELAEASQADIYAGVKAPQGEGWTQDEDTLDTWFSSGMWTFSALGWPGEDSDLKNFHPSSWMQMGYEIIFLWMIRMILMSIYALDQIPFKDVYIHGILRDESGKKFSKSSGNNIDPLEVIKQYGCDALRLSLVSGIAPGNDSRFYEEKVEGARNLVNKLWNVARFIIGNRESGIGNRELNMEKIILSDRWILEKMEKLITEVTADLENYRFSQASEKLRDFTWSDFADWYLEISKIETGKAEILSFILGNLLKLWHPFIPFVTEAIWREAGQGTLLMIEKWPEAGVRGLAALRKAKPLNIEDLELIKQIITVIRNARSEYKINPGQKIKSVIYAANHVKIIEERAELIKKLRTGVGELEIRKAGDKIKDAIYLTVNGLEIYLIASDFDVKAEREKLNKEIAEQEKRIKALNERLANKEFTGKAPEKIVKAEKNKLARWQDELTKLKNQLEHLI